MPADIDDDMKEMKHRRVNCNLDHEKAVCRRCARPVLRYREWMDSARNLEDNYEFYCARCDAELRRADLNG